MWIPQFMKRHEAVVSDVGDIFCVFIPFTVSKFSFNIICLYVYFGNDYNCIRLENIFYLRLLRANILTLLDLHVRQPGCFRMGRIYLVACLGTLAYMQYIVQYSRWRYAARWFANHQYTNRRSQLCCLFAFTPV